MSEVVDNELLISLVEARPVLWDKPLDIYKDRDATRNAWREVCLEIRSNFEELEAKEKTDYGKEVIKRWRNLRDAFVKAAKTTRESKASGSQANKKRKYIFNEELKFLTKIYTSRETSESFTGERKEEEEGNATNDIGEVQRNIRQKSPPRTRKHRKIDEVELKILEALEKPQNPQSSSQRSFLYSLEPYINNFSENEMLQFQMGVLQLISDIKNKNTTTVHCQPHSQPAPHYSQPLNYQHLPQYQHPFTTQGTSFSFQQPITHTGASSTSTNQQFLSSQRTSFPPPQAPSSTLMPNLPAQLSSNTSALSFSSTLETEKGVARNYETFIQYSNEEECQRSSSANSASSSVTIDL